MQWLLVSVEGSNAIGIFSAFLDDKSVEIYGAEPAGRGLETGQHAATMLKGSQGVFSWDAVIIFAE